MKKKTIIIIILAVIILGIIFLFLRGDEDSWIKDSRGIWIKHGNPSESNTPSEVKEQQEIINQAKELYNKNKSQGMDFSSQCLGTISVNNILYVVDIVHVPRTQEDNIQENQCEDFIIGRVQHFIKLDKEENVVRIV